MSYNNVEQQTVFTGTAQVISTLAGDEDLVYPGNRPFRNNNGGVDSTSFKRWINWMRECYTHINISNGNSGSTYRIEVMESHQRQGQYTFDSDLVKEIQGDFREFLKSSPIDCHDVKSGFQTFVTHRIRPAHDNSRYVKWAPDAGPGCMNQPSVMLTGAPEVINNISEIQSDTITFSGIDVITLMDVLETIHKGDIQEAWNRLKTNLS
jgi:hypothetical protein